MDPNLEPMPPPYHPPPLVLAGTEVRWAPDLHLISTLFQGERCKAPLEERQERCSAAEVLGSEPRDATFKVQWPRDMFKGTRPPLESFVLAGRKVAQGLASLFRETARLG